ncbi:methyltransferase domain-containing protein [Kribbella sp. NBC_01245]|uniref:methyltransferase domain-containing protein n=1 Tax=Kribbella sp. NBC_01245 TaxID=2903578 RepID=UPI002E2E6F83|nr:methyltransferase domain-containing protein [Kribbella sp. NBC_01245]
MTSTDGEHFGSFKTADIDRQDAARLAFVLDAIAAKPAVQTLKAWALAALAPKPGEFALDVGSGTGEDTVALYAITGRAVGVEPSPGLRAEAAQRAGQGEVEYVEGDATDLPYDDATFDVIRCERVLQHVGEPARAVAEMARVLKPGGRIALIDTDWQTAIMHPADPDVIGRISAHLMSQSANPFAGRQLRGLLVDAGLTIEGETAATWIEPQEGANEGFLQAMIPTSVAAGAITAEEAEAFQTAMTEAAARGAFHFSLTMYGVTGTKPSR